MEKSLLSLSVTAQGNKLRRTQSIDSQLGSLHDEGDTSLASARSATVVVPEELPLSISESYNLLFWGLGTGEPFAAR